MQAVDLLTAAVGACDEPPLCIELLLGKDDVRLLQAPDDAVFTAWLATLRLHITELQSSVQRDTPTGAGLEVHLPEKSGWLLKQVRVCVCASQLIQRAMNC